MSTQTIITTLNDDYFQHYSRQKLLGYLNRVQKWAFNHDCAQTTFLNWADPSFPCPILVTTAGKLGKYYMNATTLVDSTGAAISLTKGIYPLTIRKVRRVFEQIPTVTNKIFYGQDFVWSGLNPAYSNRLASLIYEEVPGYPIDKTDIEGAHFIFVEDPTTTSAMYYVEAFYTPPELSAETIPLCMDSDRWFEMIVDGVGAIIEDIENGNSNKFQVFAKYWLPKWRNSMNEGLDQSRPRQIPIRECG